MRYPDIAICNIQPLYIPNNGHEILPCKVVNYISKEAKIWYLSAAQSSDNFVPHQASNPIHTKIEKMSLFSAWSKMHFILKENNIRT